MKNTNKGNVITGTTVVKSVMGVATVASLCLTTFGIITSDLRTTGISFLLLCFLSGFWGYHALTDRKKKGAGSAEVIV